MRDSLLRLIDDLETKRDMALNESLLQDSPYWFGYWTATANLSGYTIQELRKVLDDHADANGIQLSTHSE